MSKMKKALLLALSIAMSATLFAACGKNKGNGGGTSSSESVSSSESDSSVIDGGESDSSVIDGSESDSSVIDGSESDSSDIGGDDSSSGGEAVTTYTFTKIVDRMQGLISTEDLEAGAPLDLSTPDAIAGKKFLGWIDAENNVVSEGTMPEGDYTVYATFELEVYTIEIDMPEGTDDVTVKFAVEQDMSDMSIIPQYALGQYLQGILPQDTKTTKVTVTGMPEDGEWKLQSYELQVSVEVVDDEDLAGTVKFFDRLNKVIVQADGTTKTNKDNYWDGTADSVSVGNQKDVTNGSDFANKLTIDYNKLTAEEKAAGLAGYSTWKGEMWVAFAIPVNNLDLTNYELTFDMKSENMGTEISAYAVQDYEGEGNAEYAFGKEGRYKLANYATELEDGWYRWTITIDCENGVSKAADYIILSLDNTPDPSKETVIYLDNMSMAEVFYYTVTIDGVEQTDKVREDSEYTPETPVKDGWEFLGWTDGDGNEVTTPIKVTGDINLVSKWEKLPIVAQVNKAVSVDLNLTESGYDLATFSAGAGTYDVIMSGGIRAIQLNPDGTIPEDESDYVEITQFVFEEDATVTFAIVYGWDDSDIYMTGTISITCDFTAGLTQKTITEQWIKDGYAATNENRAFVNGSTATAVTEGIPEGYSVVNRLDWYSESSSLWKVGGVDSNPLYRNCFDNKDVSAYNVVRFAFKLETDGDAFVAARNKAVRFESNQWLHVELVQTSANVWDLLVKDDNGAILYSVEDVVSDGSGFTPNNLDSVGTLVFSRVGYDGAAGGTGWEASHMLAFYTPTDKAMSASIYMTEVIGWKEDVEWNPEISENATRLWNHAWNNYYFTGGGSPEGAYSEEAAPKGYSYVSEYSFTGNDFPKVGHLNDSDVSEYSDLYFAMKIANGKDIYVQGASVYEGGDWLYVHLHQNEDGLWTKTLTAEDYTTTQTGLTGYQYQLVSSTEQTFNVLREYPTLCDLLTYTYTFYGTGFTGSYPRGNGSSVSTVYFTDVLAIRKDGAAITPPTAPDAEPDPDTPAYTPEISDDAVIIADALAVVGSSNAGFATVDTTDAAPAGFDRVTALKSEGKTWASYILNTGDLSDVDVQNYSEVWFAVKMVNGQISETPSYATVDGYTSAEWVYFHLIQQENTLTDTSGNPTLAWTIEITKADGTVWKMITDQQANANNTIGKILDWSDDGSRIVFYQDRDNLSQPTYLYSTEVVGVVKAYDPAIPATAKKIYDSIWRANNYALSSSTDEAAPAGFTSVKEFDWLNNSQMVDEIIGSTATGNKIPYMSNLTDLGLTCLDEADLSDLTEFWFAMKQEGGAGFYVRGTSKYTGGGWLYYHGVRAEDDTWTLYLESEDGFKYTHTGIVAETVQALINYHAKSDAQPWDSGAYPTRNATYWVHKTTFERVDVNPNDTTNYVARSDEESYVYFTEVIGIEKAYDPEISVDAVKISDSVLGGGSSNWNFVQFADEAPAVDKPAGFDTVKALEAVNADNDKWIAAGNSRPSSYTYWTSSILNANAYDTTSLTGYSEVWFAIKLANARLNFKSGTAEITGTQSTPTDWIYFHMTQNDDATWKIEITYGGAVYTTVDNQVGTDLKTLLYDGGYSSTDGEAIMIYQYSSTPINIWVTNVLGVAKA